MKERDKLFDNLSERLSKLEILVYSQDQHIKCLVDITNKLTDFHERSLQMILTVNRKISSQ